MATVLAVLSLGMAVAGCGEESGSAETEPDALATDTPARAFAPLVELPADERYRPMSARWMIERSVLWYAGSAGCRDGKIAVGHAVAEQRTPVVDWIYPRGLGEGPNYFRNPNDERCGLDFRYRHYADDLTRPHDPGPRAPGGDSNQGYYLDLADRYRGGQEMPGGTPIYFERRDEGDRGVRLTYWMLFGMNAPRGGSGAAHEGDWERVDVLLHDEGDGSYRPLSVQFGAGGDQQRDVAWDALTLVDGTHPAIVLEAGSHTPAPSAGSGCYECVRWRAWDALEPAAEQPWYGFGGAWGEVGPTEATTGPLGPHRHWLTETERERKLREQSPV